MGVLDPVRELIDNQIHHPSLAPKNRGEKRFLGPKKIFGPNKFCGSKKKDFSGPKKIWDQNDFWVPKNF